MSNGETTIQSRLETAREEFQFSGYQLHAERGGRVLDLHGGVTSYWPGGRAVGADLLFDIGSVTKVVATATLLALAVDRKELSVEDSLQKWIDPLKGTSLGAIRLENFLSHSSGIKWWHALYDDPSSKNLSAWFREHAAGILVQPPGERVVYSDLGFLLLGLVIEKVMGPLENAFSQRVLKPLGMTETRFGPLETVNSVATEHSRERERVLHGEVFDENCYYLGGRTAHAGLFSSARGLAPWAREWLSACAGKSGWLTQKTAKRFSSPAGHVSGSSWALGWDTKSAQGSSAGEKFSPKSFGHLGFPGCSVWCDPVAGGFAIFQTNRVHPSRLDERIRKLRPEIHDLVARWWEHT